MASIAATCPVVAPSVFRTAASYSRWNRVIEIEPTRMSMPLSSTSEPDDRHRQRDVAEHARHPGEDLLDVDDDDVRESSRQVALEPRPRVCGGRPFHRRDEGRRRRFQDAGPEHEHEAAGARVGPVHRADARDGRLDRPAEDVEPDRVARPQAAAAPRGLPRSTPALRPAARRARTRPPTSRSLSASPGRYVMTYSRPRPPPRPRTSS